MQKYRASNHPAQQHDYAIMTQTWCNTKGQRFTMSNIPMQQNTSMHQIRSNSKLSFGVEAIHELWSNLQQDNVKQFTLQNTLPTRNNVHKFRSNSSYTWNKIDAKMLCNYKSWSPHKNMNHEGIYLHILHHPSQCPNHNLHNETMLQFTQPVFIIEALQITETALEFSLIFSLQ